MRTSMIALFAGTALASSALAAPFYTWNLSTPNGEVSSPHVYKDTTNTFGFTARGYTTSSAPTGATLGQTWGPSGSTYSTGTILSKNLFGKNEGAGETGLGLAGLASNEIQWKSFIQLDFADLYTAGFTNLHISISSIQDGEGYYFWGSNTVGVPGKLLRTRVSGGVANDFDVPSFGTYRYFSVSATKPLTSGAASDVLIENGLTATIPTPGALSLMLLGGLVARRRR